MLKSLSLAGSRALVTGSGSGIGRQIALGFAEAGADLILVGRRLDALERTAALIKSEHKKDAVLIAADITTEEGIAKIAKELHGTRVQKTKQSLGVQRIHLLETLPPRNTGACPRCGEAGRQSCWP